MSERVLFVTGRLAEAAPGKRARSDAAAVRL